MRPRGVHVERISISLPPDLLKIFDRVARECGYEDRSKAIQEAMRIFVSGKAWADGNGEKGLGTLLLIYDPSVKGSQEGLVKVQHRQHDLIVSTAHSHIDERNCLELIMVKGQRSAVRNLEQGLIKNRGVKLVKTFFFRPT